SIPLHGAGSSLPEQQPDINHSASKAECGTNGMKPAPAQQQLTSLRARKIATGSKQLVIRRHDDAEGDRHDPSDKKSRAQPTKPATLKPHRDATKQADDRKRRLHPGGALVARSPLLCRRTRLEAHASRMLRDVDVECRPRKKRRGKHREKL